MSDGLSTPAQHLAAAEEAMDALPDDAKQGLAASVVQGLAPSQQQAAAQGVIDSLPDDAKQGPGRERRAGPGPLAAAGRRPGGHGRAAQRQAHASGRKHSWLTR